MKATITQNEFKKLFGLDAKCIIPKDTLKQYNNQIRGAYLLYKEVLNIKDKNLTNIDGTKLAIRFERCCFQEFVDTRGSHYVFNVDYIDEYRGVTPFWTYTKYENNEELFKMKTAAYSLLKTKILDKLNFQYSKYGFTLKYIDNSCSTTSYSHPNDSIWWDGLKFEQLHYIGANEEYRTLNDYAIAKTITNRKDIWNGDIPKPIQKIMDDIELKK